jgi:hypothetical protein
MSTTTSRGPARFHCSSWERHADNRRNVPTARSKAAVLVNHTPIHRAISAAALKQMTEVKDRDLIEFAVAAELNT